MRLIVIQDDAMVFDVTCGREAIYIGSREDCRVHLPDVRMAPQQAVLYPEGRDHWCIEQLDPTIEVHVNGTTVVDRMMVKTADEIQILEYTIRAFPGTVDDAVLAPAAPPPRVETGISRVQFERFAQSKLPPTAIIKKLEESVTLQPGQMPRAGQISLSTQQCITIEGLMDIALRALLDTFAAHRAWMGVRRVNYGPMEYVEGRLVTGQSADLTEVGENLKPRILDRAQFIVVPMVSPEDRTSILAGPLAGPEAILGMLYVDTGDTGRKYDARDLDYFIAVSTVLAVQLDAIFREIARNRAATIEGQVSVAHEIQARLTPRKLPQWEELQFGAFREPGRQQTGDIYDIVRMSNGMAAIMIAHTSAGGPFPSMLIAQTQAAFRSAIMHLDAPNIFLRMLNVVLYDGQKDHPLDCFMGIIDPKTGELRYAMAGRMGAYIIGLRGEERRLGPESPAPPLGIEKAGAYAAQAEQLENEETLVLFTPGVTTAKNRKDETFGEDRFVNILCDGFGQLASAMLKEMLSDLRNFTEGGQQPEDITVILAHRV
jgi:serine phosphatase RsbU (regulator of sigma subunit)